jgi:tyrosyl-tRNA synthetase
MKEISFFDFIRDIGKHITVNYMMSKECEKTINIRCSRGNVLTEFTCPARVMTLCICTRKDCTAQMGGSDQWGNIQQEQN